MANEINLKLAQDEVFLNTYNDSFKADLTQYPDNIGALKSMVKNPSKERQVNIERALIQSFFGVMTKAGSSIKLLDDVLDNTYIDGQSLAKMAETKHPQLEARDDAEAMYAIKMAELYAALQSRDKVIQLKDKNTISTIVPEIVPQEKKGLAGFFQGIANFFKEAFGASGSLRSYKNMAEEKAPKLEKAVRDAELDYSVSKGSEVRRRAVIQKAAINEKLDREALQTTNIQLFFGEDKTGKEYMEAAKKSDVKTMDSPERRASVAGLYMLTKGYSLSDVMSTDEKMKGPKMQAGKEFRDMLFRGDKAEITKFAVDALKILGDKDFYPRLDLRKDEDIVGTYGAANVVNDMLRNFSQSILYNESPYEDDVKNAIDRRERGTYDRIAKTMNCFEHLTDFGFKRMDDFILSNVYSDAYKENDIAGKAAGIVREVNNPEILYQKEYYLCDARNAAYKTDLSRAKDVEVKWKDSLIGLPYQQATQIRDNATLYSDEYYGLDEQAKKRINNQVLAGTKPDVSPELKARVDEEIRLGKETTEKVGKIKEEATKIRQESKKFMQDMGALAEENAIDQESDRIAKHLGKLMEESKQADEWDKRVEERISNSGGGKTEIKAEDLASDNVQTPPTQKETPVKQEDSLKKEQEAPKKQSHGMKP